jgi:hypothetical protein
MNNSVPVKQHHDLDKFTTRDVQERGAQIFGCADQGIQATVVGEDGAVRSVVGLNGVRYLPDPDPDPLDEVMSLILDAARKEKK